MQKRVSLVDLVKDFQTRILYFLAKIGVDTAENEPLKVHLIFKLWDLIFTEPPRPRLLCPEEEEWRIPRQKKLVGRVLCRHDPEVVA